MNILVIAPHPDDESIGCGGTILLHVGRGDRVCVVCLTSGERGLPGVSDAEAIATREAEAAEACGVLGAEEPEFLRLADGQCDISVDEGIRRLTPIVERTAPDVILLPHPEDHHPDHRAALPIASGAIADLRGKGPELRGYEIWTPMPVFHYVEDISTVMPRKLEAISKHRSQLAQLRYDRAAKGINEYRGALAGRCEFAEVMAWVRPAPPTAASGR